jgi:hypothetical protein
MGVESIKELVIPDSYISPLSAEFLRMFILNKFIISSLDWKVLDINLDLLTTNERLIQNLKRLTLYSSGNWGVLYHWISMDGLVRLKNVSNNNSDIG